MRFDARVLKKEMRFMTVKECIAAAAVELGIGDEVRDCLDGVSSTASGDVKNLLQCFI